MGVLVIKVVLSVVLKLRKILMINNIINDTIFFIILFLFIFYNYKGWNVINGWKEKFEQNKKEIIKKFIFFSKKVGFQDFI
jgi:hypothetical protein